MRVKVAARSLPFRSGGTCPTVMVVQVICEQTAHPQPDLAGAGPPPGLRAAGQTPAPCYPTWNYMRPGSPPSHTSPLKKQNETLQQGVGDRVFSLHSHFTPELRQGRFTQEGRPPAGRAARRLQQSQSLRDDRAKVPS